MASHSGVHKIVSSQKNRGAPPTMPHLRVVPLPPPLPEEKVEKTNVDKHLDKIEDIDTKAILDEANQFAGLLTQKETGIHKLVKQLAKAGDFSKDKALRAFEHLRLLYQLKLHVHVEQLKARRLNEANLNRWVVTTYKLLGFTVLTVIVVALVGYLGANVFYWFSSSWVEPTVIEPTDERVISLSAQLAQQSSTRDKIAVDLADAERTIAMHQQFLEGARQALAEDLQVRKAELNRLQQLGKSFVATRAQVKASTSVYSGLSRRRIKAEYQSHLIDRESAVTGAMQLSQLAQGNLNLAEKDLELAVRQSDLARQTETLAAIFDHRQPGRHSLEMLRTVNEIRKIEAELARAIDNKTALQASLERYNKIVSTLKDAPLLRAVEGRDAIAFVPYDNLDKAKPGEPLYACYLGPLFCKKVGTVAAVLPGEMSYKHPLHNSQLRGQPLLVELSDKRAAERKVLFAGGRPILF